MLVCLGWGMSVIMGKYAVADLGAPPLFFAMLRTLLVAATLSRFLWPLPAMPGRVFLATMMLGGGSFALLFIGLQTASASSASIVTLSAAPLTVLFAIFFLGERVGWWRGLGMALTLGGVGVVVADPSGMQASTGLFYVGGSALVGALGSVMLKQLVDTPAVTLQAWAGVSGTILLLPLSLLLEQHQISATMAGGWALLGCIAFSGLIVSVLGHTTYYALLQKYDANLIAPLTLMTPVFTILLGIVLMGEKATPGLAVGGLLAMLGVAITVIRPSRVLPKWLLLHNPVD
ncbi:MAG: DMT family transporter [Sphingobium sp.]